MKTIFVVIGLSLLFTFPVAVAWLVAIVFVTILGAFIFILALVYLLGRSIKEGDPHYGVTTD